MMYLFNGGVSSANEKCVHYARRKLAIGTAEHVKHNSSLISTGVKFDSASRQSVQTLPDLRLRLSTYFIHPLTVTDRVSPRQLETQHKERPLHPEFRLFSGSTICCCRLLFPAAAAINRPLYFFKIFFGSLCRDGQFIVHRSDRVRNAVVGSGLMAGEFPLSSLPSSISAEILSDGGEPLPSLPRNAVCSRKNRSPDSSGVFLLHSGLFLFSVRSHADLPGMRVFYRGSTQSTVVYSTGMDRHGNIVDRVFSAVCMVLRQVFIPMRGKKAQRKQLFRLRRIL